jgi:hypothetical protein
MDWFTPFLCMVSFGMLGCGGGEVTPPPSLPPLGPITIADPMSYLAGTVDGRKQIASDPIRMRRYDFGHYQVTDSFLLDDNRAVVTWDYPVFGQYAPTIEGDGGEQYVLEGDTVRIEGTRHGTTGHTAWFTGPRCGGHGWLAFRTDATEQWKQVVARLGTAFDPNSCKSGDRSLTRYTKRMATFPVLGAREAIISEHYDAATIAEAKALERFMFVPSLGRVVWQAFNIYPAQQTAKQLAARCPDFGWNTAAHLPLRDCRVSVHSETTDGSITGANLWSLGR